jgi:hypothetical protein
VNPDWQLSLPEQFDCKRTRKWLQRPELRHPSTIAGVEIDNTAHNARYSDRSINLAVTYDIKGSPAEVRSGHHGREGGWSRGRLEPARSKRELLATQPLFGNGYRSSSSQNIRQHFHPLQIAFAHPIRPIFRNTVLLGWDNLVSLPTRGAWIESAVS